MYMTLLDVDPNPRVAFRRDATPAIFPVHLARIPSVNRIPVEVLGEIFHHYIRLEFVYGDRKVIEDKKYSSSPTPTISTHPDSETSPVLLSHVCGYWRDAALSMPTLWSSIAVHMPRTRSHISIFSLWLERSGTCPLSLFIHQHPKLSSQFLAVLDEILYLLTRQLGRWKEIDFKLRSPRPPLMNLPEILNGILESAILDTFEWDYASADKLWRSIHGCPSMRRAEWSIAYFFKGFPTHIPWAQLTHITFPLNLSAQVVTDILSMCPGIETLKFSYNHHSSIPFNHEPLQLPNLYALNITTNSDLTFDLFTLPSLETLNLSHTIPSGLPRNPQSLNNFLRRSSCRLRSFSFTDWSISKDNLAGYLALPSLRSVTDLKICAKRTDEDIYPLSFTADGPANILFPLESLSGSLPAI